MTKVLFIYNWRVTPILQVGQVVRRVILN